MSIVTVSIRLEYVNETLLPRIPATEVFPVVEDGNLPAKATVFEAFPIRATVFREGHDAYAAEAVLIRPSGSIHSRALMHDIAPGLDRYEAWLMPDAVGKWSFRIDTWSDPYATWRHDASVKIGAEVDVELMLEEGALLMERAARGEALNNPSQKQPSRAGIQTLLLSAVSPLAWLLRCAQSSVISHSVTSTGQPVVSLSTLRETVPSQVRGMRSSHVRTALSRIRKDAGYREPCVPRPRLCPVLRLWASTSSI